MPLKLKVGFEPDQQQAFNGRFGTSSFADLARGLPDRGAILLVDDDSAVRSSTARLLEYAGFQVITASTGPEALKIYGERSAGIAAVVLDLSMPAMSGQEVLRQLRQLCHEVKVILTTGLDLAETVEQLDGALPNAFLQKPYRFVQLITELGRVTQPPPA